MVSGEQTKPKSRMLLLAEVIGAFAALLTVLSVSSSAVLYYAERPSRQRATVFGAWAVVSGMEGKRADGARSVALKQLRDNHESLAGIVLDGSILNDVDLSDTNLLLASLRNVEFNHCRLASANLTDANMQGGHFRDGCDFSFSKFERTDLRGAVLADSNLFSVRFLGSQGNALTSFNNAKLIHSTVTNGNFNDVVFDNSELGETVFVSVGIQRASFLRVKLDHTRFAAVTATEANFVKAIGDHAQFVWGTDLDDARFDRAVLTNPVFQDSHLRGTTFFASQITQGTFKNCDLTNADFTSATLTATVFENCIVQGASFTHAKLQEGTSFKNCQGKPVGIDRLP